MVYELGDYIETDFVMLVHYDGFIVHPELWRDEFLDYDYIGAPWPLPKEGTIPPTGTFTATSAGWETALASAASGFWIIPKGGCSLDPGKGLVQ